MFCMQLSLRPVCGAARSVSDEPPATDGRQQRTRILGQRVEVCSVHDPRQSVHDGKGGNKSKGRK